MAATDEKIRITVLRKGSADGKKARPKPGLPDKEDTMNRIVLQLILIGIVLMLLMYSTPAY